MCLSFYTPPHPLSHSLRIPQFMYVTRGGVSQGKQQQQQQISKCLHFASDGFSWGHNFTCWKATCDDIGHSAASYTRYYHSSGCVAVDVVVLVFCHCQDLLISIVVVAKCNFFFYVVSVFVSWRVNGERRRGILIAH